MKMVRWVLAGTLTCSLGGCAAAPQFPAEVEKKIVIAPEFGVLQAEPEVYRGRGILLAGEVTGVEPISSGVLIVSQNLPVARQLTYPTYRPVETMEPIGRPAEQVVLFYPGHIDPQGLLLGNKFVAMAEVRDFRSVTIAGVSKTTPYFLASCLHVWKTGHQNIADFRDNYNQTYARLEEDTYCSRSTVPAP